MMKVYFDVNIILDWALQREEFYPTAKLLIDLVEKHIIIGYVSPLAIANAHYFVKKKVGKEGAHTFLTLCKFMFVFIDNSAQSLTQAIDEPYKDFEDDLHFYSALEAGITTFVTRNPNDFPPDKNVEILSPAEMLYQLGY